MANSVNFHDGLTMDDFKKVVIVDGEPMRVIPEHWEKWNNNEDGSITIDIYKVKPI